MTTAKPERRKQPRSYAAGLATTRFLVEKAGTYVVRNLSLGGALLVGGPPVTPGSTGEFQLDLIGIGTENIQAIVLRSGLTSDGSGWIAVEFRSLTEHSKRQLEEAIKRSLVDKTIPGILLADERQGVLTQLAELLTRHGRPVFLARTSLDAMHWLTNSEISLTLAMVGLLRPPEAQTELLSFILEEDTEVHLVQLDVTPTVQSISKLLELCETEPRHHTPWLMSKI